MCEHSNKEAPSTEVVSCRLCESRVRGQLKDCLNETSIPHRIFCASSLQVTQSGKVDRAWAKQKAVEILAKERAQSNVETEAAIVDPEQDYHSADCWLKWFEVVFQNLLGRQANLDDSFFDLGGTSITIIQLLSLIQDQIDRLGLKFVGRTSLLQLLEEHATPRHLAALMMAQLSDTNRGDGGEACTLAENQPDTYTSQDKFSATSIEVTLLQAKDISEVSELAADTFCLREPVMVSLLKNQKRAKRFRTQIKSFCKQILTYQMCFVARRRRSSSSMLVSGHDNNRNDNRIIAFTLVDSVEHTIPVQTGGGGNDRSYSSLIRTMVGSRLLRGFRRVGSFRSQLPELKPAEHLYTELFHRWCVWRDTILTKQDCIQIVLSGAAREYSAGAAAVGLCEAAAIQSAREKGYRMAYTICTNTTTKYIATHELGMRKRASIKTLPYFEKHGVDTERCRALGLLSDDHEVALYDIFLDTDRAPRLDCTSCLPTTTTIRLVALRHLDTPMLVQIDDLIAKAFQYVRPGDISREMRHLRRREGYALLLLQNDDDDDDSTKVLIGCAILYKHPSTANASHNDDDTDDTSTTRHIGRLVELLFLAVRPEDRGRGGSSRMLAEIKRLKTERFVDWCLFLRATTPSLRRMYQQQGFRRATAEIATNSMTKLLLRVVRADENDADLQNQVVGTDNDDDMSIFMTIQ